ncbi:hypothetical protein ACINWC323_3619 [Acinetobacter sp. WC-323]|uniref:hypothetical protein n=1 Tax=Acinetobacter sp. WC-323 TaxID=903918 RepID=UPI00029E6A81|nr:hypothetical protein [Acinetobacter sp. WC-323]EKU57375.1 hypothetical protein ACINWC323_3619 [Acinetobacter sp. WC-323]
MLKQYLNDFLIKDRWNQLYFIAVLIFITGILFVKQLGPTNFLIYISFFLFEIGFLWWLLVVFKKYRNFKYLKPFIFLCQLVVVWLANVFARDVVASTMGLPPTDFDATIALLTFIYCIPSILIVTSTLLALIGIGVWCVYILRFGFLIFKDRFMESFSLFHVLGLMITIGLMGEAYKVFFVYEQRSSELVKSLAYSSDYYQIPNYMSQFPELNSQDKVHLHDNGVISKMVKTEHGYQIIIEKLP